MLDIYLIRHAESLGNVNSHLIGGRSNHFPLSERGIEQAQLLGKRLVNENATFDFVYSSTAIRAKDTADIVCDTIGYPREKIEFSEHLLELCQGDWVGQERKLIYTEDMFEHIRANPLDHKAPNGESPREVEERMHGWMEDLLPSWEQNLRVAVFSHGMAIKCLLRRIMNADPNMTHKIIIDNTSITRLKYNHKGWYVERTNDCSHLAKMDYISYYF